MKQFLETAESRETSPELMEAILAVAGGDEAEAERIWTDGPDAEELALIVARVTKDGLIPATEFCWGASGSRWASVARS